MADDFLEKYRIQDSSLKVLEDPNQFMLFLSKGGSLHQLFGFSIEVMLDFYGAASRLLQRGYIEDARDGFFFLATIAPKVSEFWRGLAFSCMELQQFDNAIANGLKAIECDNQSIEAYLTLVRIYCKIQDFDRAYKLIDDTLEFANRSYETQWSDGLKNAMLGAKNFVNKASYAP